MPGFDLEQFTQQLLAEALFYDEEFGAIGNVSLIDQQGGRERYLASYNPEDGTYLIEEAVEWEDYTPGEEDDIGYALAVDGKEHSCLETPQEAARTLLDLAREHNLTPSVILLYEEEER